MTALKHAADDYAKWFSDSNDLSAYTTDISVSSGCLV